MNRAFDPSIRIPTQAEEKWGHADGRAQRGAEAPSPSACRAVESGLSSSPMSREGHGYVADHHQADDEPPGTARTMVSPSAVATVVASASSAPRRQSQSTTTGNK